MVTRFLSGQKPLYKPVDYDKLEALAKLKQSSGVQSLKRIEQLTKKNEQSKEQQLLGEHKRIWEKEVRRLKEDELKIDNEISLLKLPSTNFEMSTSSFNKQLYEDIANYEISLKKDLPDFVAKTLQPITDLREDIKYYLETNRDQLIMGVQNNDDIINVIDSVKQQHALLLEKLDADEIRCEEDLHSCMQPLSVNNVQLPDINIGVPDEILLLDCPDESLKISCLTEFDMLDEKYVSRLESLEEKYESAIRRSVFKV